MIHTARASSLRYHRLLSLLLALLLGLTGLGAVTHEYSHPLSASSLEADDDAHEAVGHGKHPCGHVCEICQAFAHFAPALSYFLPALVGCVFWRLLRGHDFHSHLAQANIVYFSQAPPSPLFSSLTLMASAPVTDAGHVFNFPARLAYCPIGA